MEMVRRSGQQGVPVITVDDEVIVGFDQARLQHAIGRENGGSQKAAGRPRLGAAVADASSITRKQGEVATFGAYVGKVSPDSAAADAGLEPGDIITEINLRRIANAAGVEQALAGAHAGDNLEIGFLREGRPAFTRAQLG